MIDMNGAVPRPHDPPIADTGLHSPIRESGGDGKIRAEPLMDKLPRPRDLKGNRLGWSFHFWEPMIASAIPIVETALNSALIGIEERTSGRSLALVATIRDFHDRKLLPALRRHLDTIAFEEAELAKSKENAISVNCKVEETRAQLEEKRVQASSDLVEKLAALEDTELPEAQEIAGSLVAQAGGVYNSANPSDDCVLRHKRRPLEAIAADLKLPWAPGDKHEMIPGWIGGIALIAVSCLVGLSLALAVHLFTTYDIQRKWPLAAIAMVVGIGVTYASKQSVRGAWRHVGQAYYSAGAGRKWKGTICAAIVRTAAIVLIDIGLERQGLLATMQLNHLAITLSGGNMAMTGVDQLISWIVPAAISTALFLWSGDQGYLAGRHHEVMARLIKRQEDEWTARDEAIRSAPRTQAALEAIARVRRLLVQRDDLRRRIAEKEKPYDIRIQEELRKLRQVPESLSSEAKMRIQDTLDDLNGTQIRFNELWSELRNREEARSIYWIIGNWFRSRFRKPNQVRNQK